MNLTAEEKKQRAQKIKKEKKITTVIRAVIQVFFFFAAPAIFTTSFSGIKYIVTQLAGYEVIEPNTFLKTLIVMLIYTIVFGRFICGYACSFGSVQDWLYALTSWILKKRGIKRKTLSGSVVRKMQWIKYVILILIVGLIFVGVFETVYPLSPWSAFSQITSRQFQFAGIGISAVVLVLLLIGSCLQPRFFCHFFCPMGATFAIMPILPISHLKREKENCLKGCSLCERNCPVSLSIQEDFTKSGECIGCNQCLSACPTQNIRQTKRITRGNEWWIVIVKAVILYAAFYVVTNI